MFEVIAKTNYGYNLNNTQNLHYSKFLNIDAIFMPIIKINYKIIAKTSVIITKKESLFIELTTNGSLSPQEAFNKAATILTKLFSALT